MNFRTGNAQVRLFSLVSSYAFSPTWIIKCVNVFFSVVEEYETAVAL